MNGLQDNAENGHAGFRSDSPPGDDHKMPISLSVWRLLLVLGVFVYGAEPVFIHLSKVNGTVPYSSASCILIAEVIKMTVSTCMLLPYIRKKQVSMPSFSYIAPLAVPAILYCFNNNIYVHMQNQMDPATFQLLGNMKILATAILYRLIIKREITKTQWLSLGLLTIAGIFNNYGNLSVHSKGETIQYITKLGLLMITAHCTVSGLAGVYTEVVFKKDMKDPIYLQNSILYFFGVLLNGGAFLMDRQRMGNTSDSLNFFHGYSVYTWLLVGTHTLYGLIASVIFKYGSNITRLFVNSSSMVITMGLSWASFGLQPTVYFCAAFVVVVVALYLYHKT